MTRRSLVFSLSEWPLAEPLADAYGLEACFRDAAVYLASCELPDLSLPEKETTTSEQELLDAVIFQLAQSFLRDPTVRSDFYEGGRRSLSYAYFVGISVQELADRLAKEDLEVWRFSELMDRRLASEPDKVTIDDVPGEGIVDRHRAAYQGMQDEQVFADTLARPDIWSEGLNSAGYYLLAAAREPARFDLGEADELGYALSSLFAGHASHAVTLERLARILSLPHFSAFTPDWRIVDEMMCGAPDQAYAFAKSAFDSSEGFDRVALAAALCRHALVDHRKDLHESLVAAVSNRGFGLGVERIAPILFREEPALTCRWLPTLWSGAKEWGGEEAIVELFELARTHLPEQLDEVTLAALREAGAAAQSPIVRREMVALLERCGLDIKEVSPVPKTLKEVNVTLTVATDMATLAIFDASAGPEEGWTEEDLLELVQSGEAAGISTCSDGSFRVRFSGSGLTRAERRAVSKSAGFRVRASKGSLRLDGGTGQSAEVLVPRGKLGITVHALGLDEDEPSDLPHFVVVLSRKALPLPNELPVFD